MPLPLQLQLFDAFLGEQEGIHSVILPDIFSSGGSSNLFIDKFGRAKKIDGYTVQNSTAVTTDTGGSATLVRGMFPYRTVLATTTRQIIGVFDDGADEYEIHSSTDGGATWTFVEDLGATVVGQVPDFAQFGDELYITTGKVAPRKWDGSSLTTAGRSQSPTVTSADASTTGNLSGNFKWKLVSIIDGERQAGSVASTVLALTDSQASLSWTADPDTTVDGYELYRTTGSGEVYYLVDYIDGRLTVAFTDNKADLDLLEERSMKEHGDAPPTTYFVEPHKQRLWYGRQDANPTRAYWSDPALPEDVLAENFLDFSDGETLGDVITGMIGNFEGRLVVFTERAVWTVSGSGRVLTNQTVDWARQKTNTQVGGVTHRAVARIPAGAKYSDQNGELRLTEAVALAYFTPFGDIRLFDGTNDLIISTPKTETLATFNYEQRHKIIAIPDTKRSEVTWIFPDGAVGEPDTAVTWNYRWGVWYDRSWPFSSGVETEDSDENSIILGGSNSTTTGGTVFQLWNGSSFNGANIKAVWMTKTLSGVNEQGQPALSVLKRWRWMDLVFQIGATLELTLEWLPGFSEDNAAAIASTTISPNTSDILTADGDRVTSAEGDVLVVGAESTTAKAILKDASGDYLHTEGIRLRISDDSTNGSWSLEGLVLAYQLLPGLQRRMQ